MPRPPTDRPRPSATVFRRLAAAVIVATVIVTVSGAIVRLSKSGLGCTDWPACEADSFVASTDDKHAMIEFINRMLSGLLGLPILALVIASLMRRPFRRDLLAWSLGLLGTVLAEAVLGAVVVRLHLTPVSVIGHFVLAMVILWMAVVLHHTAGGPIDEIDTDIDAGHDPVRYRQVRRSLLVSEKVHTLVWLGAIAAAITIVAGTFVTGSGPHGGDTRAERLPFEIPSVVRFHSLFAWATLAVFLVALYRIYKTGADGGAEGGGGRGVGTPLRRAAGLVTAALVLQGALGYFQYFTGVPAIPVGFHVLGSALVWIAAVKLVLSCSVTTVVTPEPPVYTTGQTPAIRLARV